jgi:hypothetical protein
VSRWPGPDPGLRFARSATARRGTDHASFATASRQKQRRCGNGRRSRDGRSASVVADYQVTAALLRLQKPEGVRPPHPEIVPGERGRQPSTHARCPTNAGADIGAGRLPGGRPALVLTCGPERVARIRRGERSGARPPRGFLIGRISGMGHSRTCRQGAVAAIVRRRRWCGRSGEAVAELLTDTTARCLRPSRDLAAALAREAVCFGGGLSRDSGQHPRCRLRIALGRRRWAACRRRVSRQRAGIA